MAALGFNRLQVDLRQIGGTVSVPNAPEARLMYYLNCISEFLDLSDGDDDTRRFRDYKNYHRLSSDEKKALVVICIALRPDLLIGKCIFHDDDMCGESNNRFYELSAVSTSLVATDSVVIGGQRKRVEKIMTFKMEWLQSNYLTPLRQLTGKLEREDELRRQRAIREVEEERRQQQIAYRRQEEERRQRQIAWRRQEEEERKERQRRIQAWEQSRDRQESCLCAILRIMLLLFIWLYFLQPWYSEKINLQSSLL